MGTKRTSFLARAAATLLLAVLTTATAWADTWPEYITDVILVGGNSSEVATAKANNSGYTWCSTSLNDGTNGDEIYLGYKKGSSAANLNGDYITDFIVIHEDNEVPSTVSYGGHTYHLCQYDGGDYFESRKGNLTSHCPGGENLYLYYTTDNFSDKRAVNGISIYSVNDINDHKSGAINCYNKNGSKFADNISLNRGVSNTPYVYMHISTTTKTNRPSVDPVMASGLTYNGSAKQLIATGATLASGTMYYRLGTTGDFTSTWSNLKATAAGNYTVQYYAGSNDYSNQSDTHSQTVTIAKAPNNGVTVSCSNYLEGTAPVPGLVGTNLSTGAITYKFSTSQNGSYTTTVPSAAGTYWVKATIAGDANCNEYTTAPVSFTITYNWKLHNSGDTEEDAYVISTIADLEYLSMWVKLGNTFAGKFFKLGDNIAFDKSKENNFTPIGNFDYRFKGTFDGNGKTISGININSSSVDEYKGIFGYVDGTVKNLVVSNCNIESHAHIGAIAGRIQAGTIENCRVGNDVTLSGDLYVGGIVGTSDGGTIKGCTSAATIKGTIYSGIKASILGGIVGATASMLTDNIFTGAITDDLGEYIGAIVGENVDANLTNNYYTSTGFGGIGAASSATGADGGGARQALTISAVDGVTVTPIGTPSTYSVSGITVYDGNTGMSYGGTLYAGATEAVTLTLAYNGSVPEGYILGYSDGNGNAISGNATDGYTLTMPAAVVTVSATYVPDFATYWQADADHDGSTETKAYIITTTTGLDLLAAQVNGGNDYEGKFFKLGADIKYDYTGLGSTASNYEAIGGNFDSTDRYFRGKFDGQNHVVSGIRIYKDGSSSPNNYQGLFGLINSPAEVKNVILADATITGYDDTGAIVGYTGSGSTVVENCHVLANVTVHAVKSNVFKHGGIVGSNRGTVTRCTSAAALTSAAGISNCKYYGGIASSNYGTVTDCIYLGNTLGGNSNVGAIVGYNNSGNKITNCYYTDTQIQGKGENDSDNTLDNDASAVGVNDGTVGTDVFLAPQDTKDNTAFLALLAARNAALTAVTRTPALSTAVDITLNGRTLYKDGKWNTICLPFDVDMTDTTNPLYGATYRTVTDASITGTTLNLTFAERQRDTDPENTLLAGMPYIIKWNSGDNIVNPVFTGVTIQYVGGGYQGESIRFYGNYDTMTDVKTQALPDFDKLLMGDDNKLHYVGSGAKLGAFRAYFAVDPTKVGGGQASARLTSFNIDFSDGETTDIISIDNGPLTIDNEAGTWYTLDGRRLNSKPTAKGIYVNKGRKVVVK